MATILIADDDIDICDLLEFKLTRAGHDVVVAHDGAEALISFTTKVCDLLLLDCMMPHRTGQEVLAAVRANPERAATPVILMSAHADISVVEDGHQRGADAFLAKPFNLGSMVASVEELLAGANHLR